MAKATRAGASNRLAEPASVVDTTAQEPPPEPDHEDQVEDAPAIEAGEPVAVDASEPPKRNASQPVWADFCGGLGLENAEEFSRDELVDWYDEHHREGAAEGE